MIMALQRQLEVQATTRPLQSQTQKCVYTTILPVYARYSEIYEELGRHANPLTLHKKQSEFVPSGLRMVLLGLKSSSYYGEHEIVYIVTGLLLGLIGHK